MFNDVLRSSFFLLLCALAAPLQAQPFNVRVLDAQGQPVAGAVLSLAGKAHDKPAAVAVMDQVDKQFVPAVRAVATGTAVSFPNRDDPWFGVSDAQGRIELDAPAGQYPSTLWHPALVDMQPVDAGTLLLGKEPVEMKLPVAVTAALQSSALVATPFADAFRKAARDAQP